MSPPPGPWTPVCRCDARCLPPGAAVPAVGALRATLRRAAVAAVVAAAAALLPALPARGRAWVQVRGCRAVLRALGVRLEVHGALPAAGHPALVVSNHVSWLDVVALGALRPLRAVTGHEVRGWPVVGALADRCGALPVDRGRLRALPTAVRAVADALRAGSWVVAFPEGTTWCGRRGDRFRPALFQAALDAGADVRPVAVRYLLRPGGTATTVACFVGAEELWPALRRVARVRGLEVQVTWLALPAVDTPPDGPAARRAVAAAATAAVHAVTGATLPVRPRRPAAALLPTAGCSR